MPNLKKRKEQEVFTPKEVILDLIKAGKVGSLADKLTNDEINEIFESFTTMKQAKAKGGNIGSQMEMFEEGGLKDEGNTVDPVSGNDVPPGSTQEEVRDDIPAQLSEGEFVFPADVVRYIGLEKLMQLRQDAKQGLKQMEEMGQMGNSEEATMPDDLPFDMTDLDIDDEEEYNNEDMEMAQGGVVYAANGFAGTTTSTNQLGSRASSFGNTATRVQPKTYTPPPIPPSAPAGGFQYGATKDAPERKLSFENLFKDAGGADEYRTYVNDAGAEIQVPFKNGKVLTGFTIPEGFKLKTDKVDTAKTQTTKTKTARVESESGDGSPSDDPTGASLSFGGTSVGKGKQIGGITANLSYNINALGPGGIFSGLNAISNINQGKDVDTIGNKNGLTTNPVTMTVGKGRLSITAPEYSKVYNNPTGPEAKSLSDRLQALDNTAKNTYTYNPEKNVYTFTDALGNTDTIDGDKANQLGKDVFEEIQQEVSKGKDATKSLASRSSTQISMAQNYAIEAEDDQQSYGTGKGTVGKGYTAPTAGNLGSLTPNNDDDNSSNNNDGFSDSPSDTNNDPGGFGDMSGMDFSTGGLAGKKKPKVKKMKRGGLASKK